MQELVPLRSQPPLPMDRLILSESPSPDAAPMDVLFVGAGPAGLSGAIELARLVKADKERGGGIGDVEIGVLEKAAGLGEHSLSGAIVNPRAFRELFPDLQDSDFPFRKKVDAEAVYLLSREKALRLPTPPTMKNHGNYVASLCEIVRWLGQKAEAFGVNLFLGFPASALLVDGERVVGLRTAAAGLLRNGEPGPGASPPTDLTAKVVVLCEGTRGMLAQAYFDWRKLRRSNPQIYALGVKEIWEMKAPLDRVIHTLGWPLPNDAFGGSFFYPLGKNLAALGIVVGLDYADANLDVHVLLQNLKKHPLFRAALEGGEMLEWGAKTIPEGGYFSIPERRSGSGVLVLGDSAGLVDVPSLKGIHYAMQSGIYAARAIFTALKKKDTSAEGLSEYDRLLNESYVMQDLYRTRNMRLAFKKGLYRGGIAASLMTLSGGKIFGKRMKVEEDAAEPRRPHSDEGFAPDGKLTFSKVEGVFKSGNATRDDIPLHLLVGNDVSPELARFYAHVCPAGVYELVDGALRVNAPNCVDCKATDVLGPRWTPREGGSGPKYRQM